MIKKTSRYFFSSPDEIGYNNYLILIFSLMIVVIGSIGTITNVLLGLGWLTIASTAVPTLAFLPVYLYSRITRRYFVTKYVLIIMSLGLLNFQWFINYGTKGPLIFFFVILESFILLFLKNRAQILGTIILFVNLTALFIIEYTYPVLLSDYPNEFVPSC